MNSQRPDISILIPVHNGAATLGPCLESLEPQVAALNGYVEVLVVDDGSNDRSASIAGAYGFCRVVSQSRRGASAARNRALEESSGDRVLFLDADCVPAPDWMARMLSALVPPDVDGVVGRFISRQTHWISQLIQLDLDARYRRMGRFPETDFVNTATCGFRRSRLGAYPFDESFGKLEDIELSFRLAQQGLHLRYASDAVVEHAHPERLAVHVRRRFQYGRYAPALYRRHASKLASDSSTPIARRLQLLLMAAAVPATLASWWAGLALLIGSVGLSTPLVIRGFARGLRVGLGAPLYILAGNAGFLAGTLTGLLDYFRGRGSGSPASSSPQHDPDSL